MADNNGNGIPDEFEASTGGTPAFNPGVPSGASTNLLAGIQRQAPTESSLFVGYQRGHADDVRGSGLTPPKSEIRLTPTQLLNAYDKMDRDDFLRFRNLFVAAGIVSPGADPAAVRDAYGSYVLGNVEEMQSRGITMSPMGFLRSLIRKNDLDPSQIGSDEDYDPFGTAAFSGPKVTTSRNVTEIDEGEAWASLQGTLSQMLGRDPSDQELRDFTYRMSQSAARNPSVSRTVTQYKDGEATSSSTRTRPGFTSADLAREAYDQAQSDPDYAEFRSASYLFNAAVAALGEIGG